MKFASRFLLNGFLFTLVLSVGADAFAQASSNAAGKKEGRKQNLSFEDELVTGATEKPELFYLFQKKNFNYKRLIRLREDFVPEMRRTSEEIQRSRSAN